MPIGRDLSGQIFGRLTVLRPEEICGNRTRWMCVCDCGKEKVVRQDHLEKMETLSCGCIRDEKIGALNKKQNEYRIIGDVAEFITSAGIRFIVDAEDASIVSKFCWHKSNTGYFMTHIRGKIVQVHRLLLSPPPNMFVDHINRDKSDNRRINLRMCTASENARNQSLSVLNTTGVTGVSATQNNSYCAHIAHKYIGKYKEIEEAIVARLSAEKEIYGEFSPQSHLFERYGI
jgi:hypothetical protein